MIRTTLMLTLNIDNQIVLPCAKHETTRDDDAELSAHVATNAIHFIRCALEAQGVEVVSVRMIDAHK
jgi:hypothetical protein